MTDVDGTRWAREWTARVGAGVRDARTQRGLSQQQLSDRCTSLGYVVTRNSIMNIEGGRAETVTVQQVAVLGAALEVAPVELLYPLGSGDADITPGEPASQFWGAEWFSGRVWFEDEPDNPFRSGPPPSTLNHWRMHDEFVRDLDDLLSTLMMSGDDAEMHEARINDTRKLIAVFRDGMRKSGLVLPPFPEGMGIPESAMARPARTRRPAEGPKDGGGVLDGVDPEA